MPTSGLDEFAHPRCDPLAAPLCSSEGLGILPEGAHVEYQDYYATLGIDKKASADDIQKAYRKLARKYHPDVNSSEGAEEKFKSITEAYEVLKDPEKRSTYDRFGHQWKQRGGVPPGWQGGGGAASGFSDFFDMLFSGGFGGGPSRARLDQKVTLALTLEEAALGGPREITVRDPQTGASNSYSINLPQGVRSGQKLRLTGKGLAAPDGRRGDLFLKIDLRPHGHFRLKQRDLYADLLVTPWQAALGGQVSVKTLDGTLKVKVPAGSSTGRRIRLRGKGYPNPKGPDGDLYAEIKVMVPETLEERERELFEELAEISTFKPR
ncbi:MAG: DnaJ C-terminal domain-containing protein [Acidobacteriota bacterium]